MKREALADGLAVEDRSTEENVTAVEELVISQDDKPQTHRSTRQISRETGVAQSSVVRIIHRDLRLKCFKKRRAQELTEANHLARLVRSKLLLKKYSPSDVSFIWFTDEKVSVHSGHTQEPTE